MSDEKAMAAMLAPLSLQARATLEAGDLRSSFERAFRGPGRWSFFVVGTGSTLIVFAVSNLDDFQFADIAADISSAATMSSEALDFETMAEDAGVELSYHTEISHRATPPPGGMAVGP